MIKSYHASSWWLKAYGAIPLIYSRRRPGKKGRIKRRKQTNFVALFNSKPLDPINQASFILSIAFFCKIRLNINLFRAIFEKLPIIRQWNFKELLALELPCRSASACSCKGDRCYPPGYCTNGLCPLCPLCRFLLATSGINYNKIVPEKPMVDIFYT